MAGRVSLNKRSALNIVIISCGIFLFYIFLHVMAIAVSSGIKRSSIPSDLPVIIKSIIPSGSGKLDLTLQISIDDIIKHLEGYHHANGEATSNPVPRNVSFVTNVPKLCEDAPNLETIVYVHTSPGNAARRKNLRNTWGHPDLFQDGRMKIVFMTGQPENKKEQETLDAESKLYKDIVQGDFEDNYKNLTLKAMMGLKWISTYCKRAKYVMKADDDAFINIFELQKLLVKNKDRSKLVTCPLWRENSMPILRDPAKCMKWCVKYSEFPGMNYFPKYCAGLAYMFTNDMVPDLYRQSLTTPFFWIDDVYVTGILLSKMKDVDYHDVMKNFTLKEQVAKDEYLVPGHNPTKMFLHIKNQETWDSMWQATLNRLTDEEVLSLGRSFIENNNVLSARWTKIRNNSKQ